ncbi:MAG: substrate-binding domain-containing protein [Lachnospiraceae bacterium]|nr:substrate-binding domain-containing protein [Lachnospiraceae bacterium]
MKTSKQKNHFNDKPSRIMTIGMAVTLIIIGVTVLVLLFLNISESGKDDTDVIYDRKYAFIANDKDDAFVVEVYNTAKAEAAGKGAYLELIGSELGGTYTSHDLMIMAIASGYDAIFVEPDDTREMTDLINRAVAKGIPVITYMTDDANSDRQCYIGSNFYLLGKEYGESVKMTDRGDECDILILIKESLPVTSRNSFQTSLMSELTSDKKDCTYNVEFEAIDTTSTFSVEEKIRDILLHEEKSADLIICMDEITTTSFYKALVDYNKVGTVDVFGYYNSDTILKGVERGVINSSITVDASEMGKSCINAIEEYRESGYVSEYVSVPVQIIR